jgi:hypothetical protein
MYWDYSIADGIPIHRYGCFIMSIYNSLIYTGLDLAELSDFDFYFSSILCGDFSYANLVNNLGELDTVKTYKWLCGRGVKVETMTATDFITRFGQEFNDKAANPGLGMRMAAIARVKKLNTPSGPIDTQLHCVTITGITPDGRLEVYDPWRVIANPLSLREFRYDGVEYCPFQYLDAQDVDVAGGVTLAYDIKPGFVGDWLNPGPSWNDLAVEFSIEVLQRILLGFLTGPMGVAASIASEIIDILNDDDMPYIRSLIYTWSFADQPWWIVRLGDAVARFIRSRYAVLPERLKSMFTIDDLHLVVLRYSFCATDSILGTVENLAAGSVVRGVDWIETLFSRPASVRTVRDVTPHPWASNPQRALAYKSSLNVCDNKFLMS